MNFELLREDLNELKDNFNYELISMTETINNILFITKCVGEESLSMTCYDILDGLKILESRLNDFDLEVDAEWTEKNY